MISVSPLVFFTIFLTFQQSFENLYKQIKHPLSNETVCLDTKPIIEQVNIRSLLECLAKCSQLNSSASMNLTKMNDSCNAFNYISNSESPLKNCQLIHLEQKKFLMMLKGNGCWGFTNIGYKFRFENCNVTNGTISLTIPTFSTPTTVLCVNGWIVIQQRIDGSQSFNQSWAKYKAGFGTFNANFWLGLEKIYQLTNSASYRLRFEIDSEVLSYTIHVFGYSGNNLDVMNRNGIRYQNAARFSTPDHDTAGNCANMYSSGFWFNNCYTINLNGIYGGRDEMYYTAKTGTWRQLVYCRMMIKLN
ncbi:hypothetical protein HELRODRAFT_174641 [Helobdella robusta]|uniref:Fibrinogen C-terminal domain-containing protein n=1 Tax=Helobdella robusta TaxID=6412 RepID=T1F8C1_HELRO|nr:hypothetical protein HELRODRAFT_174641 [Helobdella robusta]ESO01678.1 hypothetical protein HELRODRAFT_174641 [Helobdella robusta]